MQWLIGGCIITIHVSIQTSLETDQKIRAEPIKNLLSYCKDL